MDEWPTRAVQDRLGSILRNFGQSWRSFGNLTAPKLRKLPSASKFAELFFFGTVCFYSEPERSRPCSAINAERSWTVPGSFARSAVRRSASCLLLRTRPAPRFRTQSRNLRGDYRCSSSSGPSMAFSKRSGQPPFTSSLGCRALHGGLVATGADGLAIG